MRSFCLLAFRHNMVSLPALSNWKTSLFPLNPSKYLSFSICNSLYEIRCSPLYTSRFLHTQSSDDEFRAMASRTSINRRVQPDRNWLKAKETIKEKGISSSDSSPLLQSLEFDKNQNLSQNQAIGMVVSAQANFMRVIVERAGVVVYDSEKPRRVSPLAETADDLSDYAQTLRIRTSLFKGENGDDSRFSGSKSSSSVVDDTSASRETMELSRGRIDSSILSSEAKEIGRKGVIENVMKHELCSEKLGLLGKNTDNGELGFEEEGGTKDHKAGVELLCVVRAVLKKIRRRVLVGDKVLVGGIDWVDRRGMIENIFKREAQIIDPPVANVDHFLVLFSMEQPKLEPFALTRFLIEAESYGIPVTLALNKSELVEEETLVTWKDRLRTWGYEPLFCSVDYGTGLPSIAFILKDQTTVIVGPSGVGKSSLINALRSRTNQLGYLGSKSDSSVDKIGGSKWFEEQKVGEVSERSGRGKHTTRNVSLLPVPEGGYLADTPGFNQPSLLNVSTKSLAQLFPEVRRMLNANEPAKCSFNDCLHLGEPGCIVKGDWERYPYYLQLLDEIKIREQFQLRTLGTKREGDVRYKVGDMGVKQPEPRLELKKHRRQSRKRINQSLLDELNDLDDADDLVDIGGNL
ncbi:uncharacterized protein LOC18438167 [Amborella trichopoda]|nr:uncharacterized protein LOC18438167 [Amborella trichopoda]|eukprot:XP_006848419.2 uncharacterized protein LOC18438167 [Amborella trichopoda]